MASGLHVTIPGVETGRARIQPALHPGGRRLARISLVVTCLLTAGAGEATGQADYDGPAVVPPAPAYIGSSYGASGSALPRWRTGLDSGRTLWVHFEDPPHERPGFWESSVRAMRAWNELGGLPISFRRSRHAGNADVTFRWLRRFETRQAGTTDWKTDGEGWLTSAVVTLATEHEDGTTMSDEYVGLVALHELGHVIGLPHSDDPNDVMHPGNRNLTLSDRDIRSARQLYERLESEKVIVP